MSQTTGPKIIKDGLTLAYDASNIKCFKGGPTTNLLNSEINSYPKVGNTWQTYNTNQYGTGTFFSIGTVSDVLNNVVTMSAVHGLRTYDVLRPQTTGGGVTANTDYFIKKWSDTTFSLHAYDGNQDGTNGWTTLESVNNDVRIAINPTNFPTMWWGAPHLANSGLVKTIVPNAFNGHECIRLNFHRNGGSDGMAYGGDTPNLVSGSTYTYSFYCRAADDNGIGKSINFSNYYIATATGDSLGGTTGLTRNWQRVTATATAPANTGIYLYWFPAQEGPWKADISEIQIENATSATPFTPTSRGTTVSTGGGLYDLSGNKNHGELSGGPVYVSDRGGAIYLDGVNDYIQTPIVNNTITKTVDIVYKLFNPGTGWGPLWRDDWRERIFPGSVNLINQKWNILLYVRPHGKYVYGEHNIFLQWQHNKKL